MNTVTSHAQDGNVPEKRCTGPCNRLLPATTDFFFSEKFGRYGVRSKCKECMAGYSRENKDHIRDYKKQYYQDHKADLSEFRKQYRQDHKAELVASKKRYYRQNKQRINEHNKLNWKQYLQNNIDHVHAYGRRYRQTDHGKLVHRVNEHRRRAFKKAVGGSHTPQQLLEQKNRQHSMCHYCSIKLTGAYHADHVVPLSRGGSNDISNIVITCPTCNCRKHNKLPHEWPEGGRLL